MKSIRRALLFSLLAGLTAIGVLASAATYVAARHEIGELLDLQLKQLANSTRIDELLRGHQPGFDPRAAPNAEGVTELVTQIWDRDGVLVYWSRAGTGLPVPLTPGYATVHVDNRDWRVYTLVQGTHALQVAQAEDEREAIATQTALRTLMPFIVLVPLFGLMIWFAVGLAASALAASTPAPTPTAAIIKERVFNDCPTATVTCPATTALRLRRSAVRPMTGRPCRRSR